MKLRLEHYATWLNTIAIFVFRYAIHSFLIKVLYVTKSNQVHYEIVDISTYCIQLHITTRTNSFNVHYLLLYIATTCVSNEKHFSQVYFFCIINVEIQANVRIFLCLE